MTREYRGRRQQCLTASEANDILRITTPSPNVACGPIGCQRRGFLRPRHDNYLSTEISAQAGQISTRAAYGPSVWILGRGAASDDHRSESTKDLVTSPIYLTKSEPEIALQDIT